MGVPVTSRVRRHISRGGQKNFWVEVCPALALQAAVVQGCQGHHGFGVVGGQTVSVRAAMAVLMHAFPQEAGPAAADLMQRIHCGDLPGAVD